MRKKEISKEKALDRLAYLCSKSEQCESDLKNKLFSWGISASDRIDILEYLKENRYLDDARFAKSYANDKAKFSYWGPGKIRAELIKRRINAAFINAALQNVENNIWKESLIRNAEYKAKNLDLTGEQGRENRMKLYRYLMGRGFPSSAIVKVIDKIKKESDESMD